MKTSLSNKFEKISYFEWIYQIDVCVYIICTFFIVISLNIFVCSYSCKLSYTIFHLLPQVIYSIVYFVLYAMLKLRV